MDDQQHAVSNGDSSTLKVKIEDRAQDYFVSTAASQLTEVEAMLLSNFVLEMVMVATPLPPPA